MMLLSANQNAYIFRVNDSNIYIYYLPKTLLSLYPKNLKILFTSFKRCSFKCVRRMATAQN